MKLRCERCGREPDQLPGKIAEPKAGDDCADWRRATAEVPSFQRDPGGDIEEAVTCGGQYVLLESFQGEVLANAIERAIVVLERIATALETIGRKS